MRTIRFQPLAILAIGIVLLIAGSAFSQMSIDSQYNIAELMQTAQGAFDLDNQDAVFLLDKKRVDWLPDGRMVEKIHRIIWIGTNYAVDHYGDHRIPYDSERCNFNVTTVRTWRDNTWWVTGETGIVETLPHELMTAYDYTNIREMMLLHNGIEIPCILEIAYEIEDKEAFREGIDGIWIFTHEEPAVVSSLSLAVPTGEKLNTSKSDEVVESTIEKDGEFDIYTWQMGRLDALPMPRTDETDFQEPYIDWSTWETWDDYKKHVLSGLETDMVLSDVLKSSLDSVLNKALSDWEKANLIADFISQKTRLISYPIYFWYNSPRPANRVFESGYAHALDRAIFAEALFKEAGFDPMIMFFSKSPLSTDNPSPTLAYFPEVAVWLVGDYGWGYYDPSIGKVLRDYSSAVYTTLKLDRRYTDSTIQFLLDKGPYFESQINIKMDLSYDPKKEVFVGRGYYNAYDYLSPFGKMVGTGSEAKEYLGSVISGIMEDADIVNYNPVVFNDREVQSGFEFELKKPDNDDLDRIMLTFGEPLDGIIDQLPEGTNLFDSQRTADLLINTFALSTMDQALEINLDLEGLELVDYPDDLTIENDAGSFSITATKDDHKLKISRKLDGIHSIDAKDWPALRQLLLAETHDRNQTIYLKLKEEEE